MECVPEDHSYRGDTFWSLIGRVNFIPLSLRDCIISDPGNARGTQATRRQSCYPEIASLYNTPRWAPVRCMANNRLCSNLRDLGTRVRYGRTKGAGTASACPCSGLCTAQPGLTCPKFPDRFPHPLGSLVLKSQLSSQQKWQLR